MNSLNEILRCLIVLHKMNSKLYTFIGVEFARGIAALMVLVSHYAYMVTDSRTFLNFLWTGVDFFFVISGFVFAKLILESSINLSSFFTRRFFRIYPIYFVILLIYFFLAHPHVDKIYIFFKHLFFLQTVTSKEEAFFFNPAFWSLPVEMEFYLLIPLLSYLTKFKNSLIIIFFCSIAFKIFLILLSTPNKIDIYAIMSVHLTGLLPEFLVGVFLYKLIVFTNTKYQYNKFMLNIVVFILGMIFLYYLSSWFVRYGDTGLSEEKIFGGFFNFLCALSYAFILFPLSFLNLKNTPKYIINIFISLGSISYPVYLLHSAIPKFFQKIKFDIPPFNDENLFIACSMLTIVLSIVIHKYIEEPLRVYGRNLSKKFEKRTTNVVK